jgi:hypothetical protein
MKRPRSNRSVASPDTDPADGMISRAALAREVLYFRMKLLSQTFYEADWVEDLEWEVWDMAHVKPWRFAGKDVTGNTAKGFQDLVKLGGGFWAWSNVVGQEGDMPVFVPLEEWRGHLAKRRKEGERQA